MTHEVNGSDWSLRRQELVKHALRLVGSPSIKYSHGKPEEGQSPKTGFDCSGFVRYVLTKSNLVVPPYITQSGDARETRHVNELWDNYGATVHESKKLPGDLVFFSRNGTWPTHIGILVSGDSYVHAPGEDATQVSIAPLRHTQIEQLVAAPDHRQVFEANPIGFKSPTYPLQIDYRVHQRILE